jgi:hypothetical protein
MARPRQVTASASAVGGLALCLLAVAAPAQAATTWSVVPSPNRGSLPNALYGVTATSATSLWAVGSWYDVNLAAGRTLVLRGSGTGWSTVSSPNRGTGYNELLAVDASSGTNAWAVGYSAPAGGGSRSAISMRWNGTSWQLVSTPNPGVSGRELWGVETLSGSDAYAVGWYYESLSPSPLLDALVLHWNGSAWSQQSVPTPGNYLNQLYDVSAVSANDVWAVGTWVNLGEAKGARHPLILHRVNGTWSVSYADATKLAFLRSVVAISSTDAWAVGSKNGYGTPVAYHWNGSTWTEVATPPVGVGGNNLFYSVTALRADQVWAAGYTTTANGAQPLVERWNGTAWRVEPTPVLDLGGTAAGAVAVAGTPTVWVAGTRTGSVNGSFTDRTLTLRGTGS